MTNRERIDLLTNEELSDELANILNCDDTCIAFKYCSEKCKDYDDETMNLNINSGYCRITLCEYLDKEEKR